MGDISKLLDDFEHECFMLRREATETRAKNDVVRTAYERIRDGYAERIAATLGSDDDYEAKMDALLCRLTNGKWSKSRAYGLDFMESCIDEEYEKAYATESDREAKLEALAKDLYENALDFNFKGWIPHYRARFAALGIEVE